MYVTPSQQGMCTVKKALRNIFTANVFVNMDLVSPLYPILSQLLHIRSSETLNTIYVYTYV